MTDATTSPLPPSIESWRGDFMEAARQHAVRRRSPLRRLAALIPVIAILGTAGAAAALDDLESPEVPPYAGETHAYIDLDTGVPITCPDGNLLTYTPPAENPVYGTPRCSDGSVPATYTEQRQDLLDYANQDRFGAAFDSGPRFDYEVTEGG